MIPDKLNLTAAQAACRKAYSELVTVYYEEENDKLNNITVPDHLYLIGLHRGQFTEKWSNGDPVTFRSLTAVCETSLPCCAAMKPDGSWESLQCNMKRYFICYEQGNLLDFSFCSDFININIPIR